MTCFCEVAACTHGLYFTNVDQAWKKIEECGNLVAEKMRTSKVQSGPAPTTSHKWGYKL